MSRMSKAKWVALMTGLVVAISATVWAQGSGWETEWAKKVGVKLLASFDSSGPPAWDAKKHPLVFVSTEGPGYFGVMSKTQTKPGLVIIDATTREVVASQQYELEGVKAPFEPHGLGVSADGRWIYLPTGTSPGFGDVGAGRLLIIDARTLKLNKILSTPTNPHHASSFTDTTGRKLVLAYGFREGNFYVFDPQEDNRIVGGVVNGDLEGKGYLGYIDPSGKYLVITVRPSHDATSIQHSPPSEQEGMVAVVDTKSWKVLRRIGVIDPEPVWVTFTTNGKFAYVSGGQNSIVTKISTDGDPSRWKVVGAANAGTIGPYGLALTWDERYLFAIGKGEGTHNRGVSVGVVNPLIMVPPPLRAWNPGPIAEIYTGCMRGDHLLMHPDRKANELWLSCNASFEIVVLDSDKAVKDVLAGKVPQAVKARIPMPNGGSTHSGAFVRYAVDDQGAWTGEVLSDHNGLRGSALESRRKPNGR